MKDFKKAAALAAIALVCLVAGVAAKTPFSSGTRVTSEFMNSIYYTGGGHVHDGGNDDGHAPKISCEDHINWTEACIPDSSIELECNDIESWTTSGCASNVCAVDFSRAACDDVLTCDNTDWSNADCKNSLPYNTPAFASTEYVFLPIEILHSGVSGNDPYVNTYGGGVGRYAVSSSTSTRDWFFSTAWRPPTASTVSNTYIRVLYTCDEIDNDNFALYVDTADEPINDGLVWHDNVISQGELNCDNDELQATVWAAFNAGDADSADGLTLFYGHLNSDIDADPTYVNIIGIEIKYSGSKE